ncbi:MAG TPA: adenylyltransferase/cytidyltransferase family protein [Acidimicrobiales bacterium]|nr:adenylyltransferase/cytidyltransferase family protein [Acidimicrobiales bacterium]
MDVGLYGGSFDPVHLGHMAVITAASELLDRLVVVVAGNSRKETGLFTVDERVALLSGACGSLGNVRVVAHRGLLVDIATRVGADVLVRSAGKEHSDETGMAYLNGRGGMPTLLIPSDPATACISSSTVRSLTGGGRLAALQYLVPPSVAAELQRQVP